MQVGDIFYTSYGYDMTINNYIKVITISPTNKTVLVKMLKVDISKDDGRGEGTSNPTTEEIGEAFRLWIRIWNDKVHFVQLLETFTPRQEALFQRGMESLSIITHGIDMNWQLMIKEAVESCPITVTDTEILVEVMGTLKECQEARIKNGY